MPGDVHTMPPRAFISRIVTTDATLLWGLLRLTSGNYRDLPILAGHVCYLPRRRESRRAIGAPKITCASFIGHATTTRGEVAWSSGGFAIGYTHYRRFGQFIGPGRSSSRHHTAEE
jgi:hypothetical protein